MNPGEVEIELNGRKEILRPSLRAAKEVFANGGFAGSIQRLANGVLDEYVAIVSSGLKKKRTDVEDDVYATGMESLSEPLARFVSILGNGGKEPKAESGENKSGEA